MRTQITGPNRRPSFPDGYHGPMTTPAGESVSSRRDYASIADRVRRGVRPSDGREVRMQAAADALWESLREAGVSWVGFYLEIPGAPEDRRLELGPSRDKPACSPIGLHGVCGQGYTTGATRIVRDVRELGASYIACDPRDRSEIVLPIFERGRCVGVLDVDSWEVGAFDRRDELGLSEVLRAAGLESA